MKEFSKLLLEIPNYPNSEALFSFMDSLQKWVRMEVQRRGAQDLATTISILESLVEFKRQDKGKAKTHKSGEGGDKS